MVELRNHPYPKVPFRIQAHRLRRQVILESATRLIETEGCFGFTIDRVATSAGVAKGVVYMHFDSKETLLCRMSRRLEARFLLAAWRRRRSGARHSCAMELAAAAEVLLRQEHTESRFARAQFIRVQCCAENCSAAKSGGQYGGRRFRRYLAEVMGSGQRSLELRGDLPAGDLAEVFLAVVFSKSTRAAAAQDSARGAARAMDIFLGGAATKP